MKLSLITVTYNCEKTICKCLASVSKQSYKNIEYIVVDGKSSDATIKLINSYSKIIDKFISEPDEGIYDAINKGIRMATGEIIGLLHADDVFFSDNTLHDIMNKFINQNIDFLYGDVEIFKNIDDSKPIRRWTSNKFHPFLLNLGWMPPHTSMFVKSSLYSEFGLFDTSFSISGDYDFILRVFKNRKLNPYYMPETLVKMMHGGVSTKNFNSFLLKSKEDLKALKKNKIIYPRLALFFKKLLKLNQFFNI